MAHEVGVGGVQQHERAGADAIALAHRDGHAAEGTAAVHLLDVDRQRLVAAGAAGEDGLHRLHLLARLRAGRSHHGLAEDLAAEDDTATLVEVLADEAAVGRFEVEDAEDGVEVAHRRRLSRQP